MTDEQAGEYYKELMKSEFHPSNEGIINMLEESAAKRMKTGELYDKLRSFGLHSQEANLLHHLQEGQKE